MNKTLTGFALMTLTGMLGAQQPPVKIAVIDIQQALVSTKEGQKAASDLQARVEPKRKELEGKQSEVAALQKELASGSATMPEAKRIALQRDIDAKTKSLQRLSQDAQDELQQEQNKVLNELGQKMLVVVDKYARDNGFAVVLDLGSQQSAVLWAAPSVNITEAVVEMYDKNSPAAAATKPAAAPATPAPKPAPAPAAPKK